MSTIENTHIHKHCNELGQCSNIATQIINGHLGATGQAASTALTYYLPHKADIANLLANRSLFTHPADKEQDKLLSFGVLYGHPSPEKYVTLFDCLIFHYVHQLAISFVWLLLFIS